MTNPDGDAVGNVGVTGLERWSGEGVGLCEVSPEMQRNKGVSLFYCGINTEDTCVKVSAPHTVR